MKQFCLLILLFIISSCNTQFGKHNGIKLTKNSKFKKSVHLEIQNQTITESILDLKEKEIPVFASIETNQAISISSQNAIIEPLVIENEECDLILFRNGDEVSVKVIEVGVDEIKYKKCDNSESILKSVLKKDVFMITYSNGSKDLFKEKDEPLVKENVQENQTSGYSQPKKHGFAVASLVFGLVGLPLFAFIFGGIAKSLVRKYPHQYDGYKMANAGILLGWISIFIIILLITLL
jgi:hypothetical protein